MRKVFCDVCGAAINNPIKDGYKLSLSNWDNKYISINGEALRPCIPNLEMCKRCANNLFIHIEVLARRYGAIGDDTK